MANSTFDLTGKTILITGGNGGIGLGMAQALAEAGADICIWGQNEEKTWKNLRKTSSRAYRKGAGEFRLILVR
jgi:NAD(P)-dependent dehydrogenase (short-subunit alcohol dehydrogenase family)